jgi:hypothetical protein
VPWTLERIGIAKRELGDHPGADDAFLEAWVIRQDISDSRKQRVDALKLLVHLVADIHQPLHCAERDGDAGGSQLAVTFFGSATTLHLVWDFGILERASYDWGEHVGQITGQLAEDSTGSVNGIARSTPAQWAWETHRVAVEAAYGGLSGTALDEDYQARSLSVVQRQLGLAGLRLAQLLHEALGSPSRTGRGSGCARVCPAARASGP